MGKGGLLKGGNTSTEPTPIGWPNQVDQPVHIWNNTGNTKISNSDDSTIVEGRNYTTEPLTTYKPLVFPHPWATEEPIPEPPDPPAGLKIITK